MFLGSRAWPLENPEHEAALCEMLQSLPAKLKCPRQELLYPTRTFIEHCLSLSIRTCGIQIWSPGVCKEGHSDRCCVSVHLVQRCMSLEHLTIWTSVCQDMLISGMFLSQWLLCLAFLGAARLCAKCPYYCVLPQAACECSGTLPSPQHVFLLSLSLLGIAPSKCPWSSLPQ